MDAILAGGLGVGGVPGTAAAAALSEVVEQPRPGPHAGSMLPGATEGPPAEGFTVKANDGSRRFHGPASPYYVRTRADLWFRTAEDAERAGYVAWDAPR